MESFEYDGELYNDDRLFVLSVSKCSVKEDRETITTIVHHKVAPENHIWCVVMYKNVPRYGISNVFHFKTEREAILFLQETAPVCPLISLQGESPPENSVLSYEDYQAWKKENNLKDYNYKELFVKFEL